MKSDHRCCLRSPADRERCKVAWERDELMDVWKAAEVASRLADDELAESSRQRREYRACGGKSLLEQMEDELDLLMVRLMVGDAVGDLKVAGEALGFARCIAFVRNPFHPDVDGVRQAAMDRYQDRVAALTRTLAPSPV